MTERRAVNPGLREFVDALGSQSPTPAGGAAAAAAAASGISLLLKVGRISGRAQDLAEWREAEPHLEGLVQRALEAVQADCDAIAGVLAARRRGQPDTMAWVRATEGPLDLVRVASQALHTFSPLRGQVKPALVADCSAAAELLSAGISISLVNARENMAWIRGSADGARLERISHERERDAVRALAGFGLGLRRPGPLDSDSMPPC